MRPVVIVTMAIESARATLSIAAMSSSVKPPARSVVQNGRVLTTRLEGCVVSGAARGDLSSEKVYVKLARMTCDQPGGRVAVSEVKGFISFAGKSGVRGRVVSRFSLVRKRRLRRSKLSSPRAISLVLFPIRYFRLPSLRRITSVSYLMPLPL